MRNYLFSAFFCSALQMASVEVLLAQHTVVDTRYGTVSGYAKDGLAIFKGIPFAAPPVGANRWKAPQPPVAWEGVRECTAFSASPMQPRPVPFLMWTEEFIAPPDPLSEDCLYLNIWTGARNMNEKRPVFVWIYGGGFSSGSAACDIYDGEVYAKKGVVFVSLNYRVGVFGFMAHPELTLESGVNASGNYGLMDQAAALKWVKENIHAFGGDPSNVTIAGQSAGSMSVNCLVASPLAKGFFQKAIAHSGGMLAGRFSANLADGEKAGTTFQELVKAKSLTELRALPADSLVSASQKMGAVRFGPVLDNYVLPVDFIRAFALHQFNDVPFISGWVTGDGALMSPGAVTPEQFKKSVEQQYGGKSGALLELFHADNAEEATEAQKKLGLMSFAVLSPHRWSGYASKPGYIYQFSHVPPDKPGFPNYGAFHTAEVPYALHTLHKWKRDWKAADRDLEEKMSGYWINFIKSGDPNGTGLVPWKRYDPETSPVLELGDVIQLRSGEFKPLLDILDSQRR